MRVRDAVEADATDMASLADQPTDVMRNLVHDRTVRVADNPEETSDEQNQSDDQQSDLCGVVSYDAGEDTVHVTQLAGDQDAVGRLLEEPVRFANVEGMAVEVLIEVDDDTRQSVVENAGFEREGSGPFFSGKQTIRYRHAAES